MTRLEILLFGLVATIVALFEEFVAENECKESNLVMRNGIFGLEFVQIAASFSLFQRITTSTRSLAKIPFFHCHIVRGGICGPHKTPKTPERFLASAHETISFSRRFLMVRMTQQMRQHGCRDQWV